MARARLLTWVAGGTFLTALVAATATGAAAAPAGWEPPVLVSATQAARETSLVLSPTDPNLRAICDPSGVPATGTGQSYFHRSDDGGSTWKFMSVETSATDPRKAAFEGGDCDV